MEVVMNDLKSIDSVDVDCIPISALVIRFQESLLNDVHIQREVLLQPLCAVRVSSYPPCPSPSRSLKTGLVLVQVGPVRPTLHYF
ncbi:hypothetical protein C5167_006978 [Papaver somniferum]|uniref:Uncharacterized protein n=1 Tax=Papaver somniferum TaxID=3469 RepID=A0A4Y7JGL3_PAPSO|nr:hypothetical protein C5167_006978 [Papaver somniferum]